MPSSPRTSCNIGGLLPLCCPENRKTPIMENDEGIQKIRTNTHLQWEIALHSKSADDARNRCQHPARRLTSTCHTNNPQHDRCTPHSMKTRSYTRVHEPGHALLPGCAGYYLVAEGTLIPPGWHEREADEFPQALLGAQTRASRGWADKEDDSLQTLTSTMSRSGMNGRGINA